MSLTFAKVFLHCWLKKNNDQLASGTKAHTNCTSSLWPLLTKIVGTIRHELNRDKAGIDGQKNTWVHVQEIDKSYLAIPKEFPSGPVLFQRRFLASLTNNVGYTSPLLFFLLFFFFWNKFFLLFYSRMLSFCTLSL